MTLHTKAEWEALEPHIRPDEIVLHHTTGPKDQSLPSINAEHVAQGWVGVGYHGIFSKTRSGMPHPQFGYWEFIQGRPDDVMGAQAHDANSHSVGYSACGNYDIEQPEPELLALIVQVLAVKARLMHITPDNIIGHCEVAKRANDPSVATACPGKYLYNWLVNSGRRHIQSYL